MFVVVVNKVLLLEFYWSAAVTLKGPPFFYFWPLWTDFNYGHHGNQERTFNMFNGIMNVSTSRLKLSY